MDIEKILAELRAERETLEPQILALERLARGHLTGPSPSWMSEGPPEGPGPTRPAAAMGMCRKRRLKVSCVAGASQSHVA
jgi:hypothetical protein